MRASAAAKTAADARTSACAARRRSPARTSYRFSTCEWAHADEIHRREAGDAQRRERTSVTAARCFPLDATIATMRGPKCGSPGRRGSAKAILRALPGVRWHDRYQGGDHCPRPGRNGSMKVLVLHTLPPPATSARRDPGEFDLAAAAQGIADVLPGAVVAGVRGEAPEIIALLASHRPDVVFNACE